MKYQHVVLGGTGHVGTALVNELIAGEQSVMIIGHSKEKVDEWQAKGVVYEVADSADHKRLHELFSQGKRLFLLNPPAPPNTDTVKEEIKGVQCILAALEGLQPEKIVAASTYGAQQGDDIGDLGVLYQLEQGLLHLPLPVAIIRSAYYMSNWLTAADIVKKDGILPTLYPSDFKLPMVAPEDIGPFAAGLLLNDVTGLHSIEGFKRYSPEDVAAAFNNALHKPVKVQTTPEENWQESLLQTGFSVEAARYMCNMTRITLENDYEIVDPHLGTTSLEEYINRHISIGMI